MIQKKIREIVVEALKELYDDSTYDAHFVGIHCSPVLFNDNYIGVISEEYFGSFRTVLETIKNDYLDAKKYIEEIELLDDGLDLYGDGAELVFDIQDFFSDNNIEWIYVAPEALTKYGDNCYEVYFSDLDNVYEMDDELVDDAKIYIYNSTETKPILKIE